MLLAFEIATPIGCTVRCTRRHWEFVTTQKHPTMRGREADVTRALADPHEIRRSRRDPDVLLFYLASEKRWLCVVVRRGDGRGFVITAYVTDAIKAGEVVWKRSS